MYHPMAPQWQRLYPIARLFQSCEEFQQMVAKAQTRHPRKNLKHLWMKAEQAVLTLKPISSYITNRKSKDHGCLEMSCLLVATHDTASITKSVAIGAEDLELINRNIVMRRSFHEQLDALHWARLQQDRSVCISKLPRQRSSNSITGEKRQTKPICEIRSYYV